MRTGLYWNGTTFDKIGEVPTLSSTKSGIVIAPEVSSGKVLLDNGTWGTIEHNSIVVDVDFGQTGNETDIKVVLTGLTWVTTGSNIITRLYDEAYIDRDIEDALLEQIVCSASNIVNGVGFTLHVHAPNGAVGIYKITCIKI